MKFDYLDLISIADLLSVFIEIEEDVRKSGDPEGILNENGWTRGDE